MKLFKISSNVCMQNLRKWSSNYRIWIVAILLLILVHSYTKSYGVFSEAVDIKISPWIYPFIYNHWYFRLLMISPLLLIFCDAPFLDNNQPYVIIRSGRIFWSLGQIAYIIVTTAIYFLFIFISSIIINLPHMEFTMEWGKGLGTLANTDAASVMELTSSVSSRVLFYFTPVQAVWFTFLLSWLCGIFLGMLIYAINSFTNKRSLGVFSAAFFVILSAAGLPGSNWFSPVNWCNIDSIDIGNLSENPPISYVITVYLTLIILLSALAIISNRKQMIEVIPSV